MLLLLVVLVVGAEVLATTPRRPPPKCRLPSGPYVKPKCGPNEYFEVCSYPHPPQNCSTLWTKYINQETCCKPECRCKDGFLRDDKSGKCIRQDECFNPCGPLEHFVRGSSECRKTCANYKVTGPQNLCKPFSGCVCNEGRVRLNDDGTGVCILPKQCPARKCPLFEHWEDCPSVCLKETCTSKNPDYKCLLPAIPLPCKPRCICDKGYLRNTFGQCIPENHCPIKKCPINEVWGCATICSKDSCKTLESGFKCPPFLLSVCIPACTCKDGYLRNAKGKCIPKDLCPASHHCGINEVAVQCASVIPQTCESVYTLYKPVGKVPCKPGCDCRPGYLRNKQNICVPSEFCPTVPQNQCGPNQEYKECGTACESSCADLDNPNQICTDQCVAGCFCKEGYLKDDQGNCIPRDKCPLPVCTQPNEVATLCGSGCNDRNCDNYKRTDIVCPAVCIRGCFCIPGYVRNAYGVCIPPDQCSPEPVCLQANEEYQSCGSSCPDNCDNYLDTGRICTANCVPGCNCKAGFVRNLQDKTCVKSEQCPSKNCTGVNEYLNLCASYCPVTCANRFTNGDWLCATVCRVACDCIPGTLRDDKGVCVPVEKCTPPVCRQNEKYLNCGTACPLTCENYKNPPKVCTRQCVEDCFCEDGFVRDRHMRCVKPEDCEPICPAGEKFNECSAHCQDTCENFDKPNRICTYQCQSGCVCEAGTVRRKDGKCVPPLQCSSQPTCSNATEVYSPCSAHCEPTCENSSPNRPCSRICKPGCKCIDGLVRRKDGQCVKVDECSPECPFNERWVPCVIGLCEPKTCDEFGFPVACPDIIGPCKGGCVCVENYLRNSDGVCIPQKDCLPQNQCGPNQEYKECGTACESSCADLDNPNQICTDQCVAGCFCKEGYLKDDQGNCIPRDKCPLPVCTQPNEVATLCGSGCNDRNCDDYKRTDIVCPAVCIRRCFCIPGYVRNAYGVCIPPDQCSPEPVCLQANEEYQSCGSSCPDNCDNYLDTERICTANCVPGCTCKAGFVRNLQDKTCVKPEQCPSQPTCSNATEVYSPCSAHCEPTCENNGRNRPCSRICKPGCKCIDGLVRRKDGQCVKVDECSQPTCSGDEVFDACSAHCEPTCENNGPNRVCTAICIPGCKCGKGLVRRKDGQCVKLKDCYAEPPCPAQEVFDQCSAHCEPTCENNGPDRACTDICSPGCKCEDGLVRRSDGKCVKLEECQYTPECPLNERWVTCVIGLCAPKTCDELGFPVACPGIIGPCKGGCVCVENYLRNSDGVCIPQKDCPSCGGDFNATSGCGSNCGNRCSNYNKPNNCSTLPLFCQYNSCDCKDGYVFDDVIQRCVSPSDCPNNNQPCSDPNAERVECASQCPSTCANPIPGLCIASCKQNECVCKKGFILSEEGGKCVPVDQCPKDAPCNGDSNAVIKANPLPCPSTCAAPNAWPYCKKYTPEVGCECKPGYLKSSDDIDGKCIKPDECPGGNPCGANGTFVWCNAGCPSNNCPVDDNRGIIACSPPFPCPSGCACKVNYRKKSYEDVQCILASDCPPVNCTRQNEVWSPCPSACLQEDCADVNKKPTTCNTLLLNCQPQCICKKGHFRDSNGLCVPAKQCPIINQCSDPNAERVECAPALGCRSTCADPNPGPCILSCALNECVCKKGFVLSEKDGKCVSIDQCPKDTPCKGDPNAMIKANPIPCPSTCAAPNASPYCKKYAPEVGCECKPGYLKSNDNGKCIKPDECPGGNPCGVNGTFVWCNAGCPNNNCPVNDNRGIIACSPPFPCPSGCACKLNYRKKSYADITCILASDCPPVNCTRQNEIWSPCPSACLRENCEDVNNQPSTCNTLVLNCQPQCICKKGYFRNKLGLCIPAKQCPIISECNDPNAERLECAPAPGCRPTCAAPNPGPCILSCAINECVCKKGFVLSEKGGKCIPKDQCPAIIKQCSDPNAERVECAPHLGCRSTCADPNPGPCILSCALNECVCKKGFVLSEKGGKCVSIDQCPKDTPCKGDPNAIIKANPIPCPSTCAAPNASPYCKKYAPEVGCECKPGYLKSNDNGKCIKPDECPGGNPCGVNGTFVWCNAGCPNNNCPVNDNRGIIACSPPFPCPSGCACKLNYRKKSYADITCILASDCPPVNCTRQNEIWSPCPSACLRENCEDVNNQPSTCNTLVLNCQPRCICKKGHFRNKLGLCIPAKQCPINSECNDPNAERLECAPQPGCRPTCATPKPGPCIQSCAVNECVCKKGFVLSEKGGKCIPKDQCPAIIKQCSDPNAERLECAPQPGCRPTCAAPNPGPCILSCAINECVCKKGFVLSEKGGKCIPKDQCPAKPQCKANEVYNPCRIICPPQTCASTYTSYSCLNTSKCEPGCDCINNYLRNGTENDMCIPSSQCPPAKPVCGLNEHYEINRCKCDLTCKNKDQEALIGPCQETSGCFCDDGYYRNTNGICVTKKQCPKPITCPANEVLSECYNTCHTTCKTRIRGDGRACSLACVSTGCLCKPGYLRHDNGTCVPVNECSPPRCNENETYSPCGTACPVTCLNRGGNCTTSCTKQCVEGCFCNKGFVRADDETCVKPKDCPQPTCSDPNEVFDKCPPYCPPGDNCSNLWSKFNCTAFENCCKPGCRCKPGYFRNNGKCITTQQCIYGEDATEAPESP